METMIAKIGLLEMERDYKKILEKTGSMNERLQRYLHSKI